VVGVDVSAVYPAGQWDALPKIGFERQLSAEGILA
jgi:ABC-type hemin transport system substrate-binding protein